MTQRRRDEDCDGDRGEPGHREQDERPDPHLPARESRDALRIDQDLADFQPRDERRRHTGAVAFQDIVSRK